MLFIIQCVFPAHFLVAFWVFSLCVVVILFPLSPLLSAFFVSIDFRPGEPRPLCARHGRFRRGNKQHTADRWRAADASICPGWRVWMAWWGTGGNDTTPRNGPRSVESTSLRGAFCLCSGCTRVSRLLVSGALPNWLEYLTREALKQVLPVRLVYCPWPPPGVDQNPTRDFSAAYPRCQRFLLRGFRCRSPPKRSEVSPSAAREKKPLVPRVCAASLQHKKVRDLQTIQGAQSRYFEFFWPRTKLPLNWRKTENSSLLR